MEITSLLLPFLIFTLISTAFWVYTLYRILTDEVLDKTNKIIWVVAIMVAPLIGCIFIFCIAGPADQDLNKEILNRPFNTPTIHENQETPRKILL